MRNFDLRIGGARDLLIDGAGRHWLEGTASAGIVAHAPPVVAPIDAGRVDEESAPVSIDLLAGQSDPDGDALTVQSASATDEFGDAVPFQLRLDGTVVIDPHQFDALGEGESRTVTVSYEVSDGTSARANTATLTVTGSDDGARSFGFVMGGAGTDDKLGSAVSSAGDVNGDGIDDLLVGANGVGGSGSGFAPGAVYVIFGRDASASGDFENVLDVGSLDASDGFVLTAADAGGSLGSVLASAGDVNGDGIDDMLVSAPYADPGGTFSAGEIYVVFGRDTASDGDFAATIELGALDGTDGFALTGASASDKAGGSVSSAGDINGDGIDDILIGAVDADPSGIDSAGVSYVVFGRDTAAEGDFAASIDLGSLNGANGFALTGVDEFDSSGSSVSAAGDVNGDGIDDLMIGAERANPRGPSTSKAGETVVMFGRDTAVEGDFAATISIGSRQDADGFKLTGVDADDFSGWDVSSAGDVNGDGIDDMIIGAPRAEQDGQTRVGEAYVVFGRDTAIEGEFDTITELGSLDGTDGFVLRGSGQTSQVGSSVSSAGDVDGDGIDDMIVAGVGADEAYVILGRDTAAEGDFAASIDLASLDGTDGYVLTGIGSPIWSGDAVSSAGDLNGDGIDDIVIGSDLAEFDAGGYSGEAYVAYGGKLDDMDAHDGTVDGEIDIGRLSDLAFDNIA